MTQSVENNIPGPSQNVPVQVAPAPYVSQQPKLVRSVLLVAGSLLVIGGSAWFISHEIKKAKENKEQRKTLSEGTPANFSKMLKMAFDNDGWWGTNVPLVRTVFSEIPSQEFYKKVEDSYRNLTRGNELNKDLESELTTTEFSEMTSILNAKPKKEGGVPGEDPITEWAKRLKAAFDYTVGFFAATDEDAITAVYNEIPTQDAYEKVKTSYKKQYTTDMEDDLYGELWDSDAKLLIDSIKNKPLR